MAIHELPQPGSLGSWLMPKDPPGRTHVTKVGRSRRKAWVNDRDRYRATTSFINQHSDSVTQLVTTDRLPSLLHEEREPAFWDAVTDFMEKREAEMSESGSDTGLNVLIVNQGDPKPERNKTLPVAIEQRIPGSRFTVLGNRLPYYNFLTTTEAGLEESNISYDLILVLGDEATRFSTPTNPNTQRYAKLLIDHLNPEGRLVMTADESADNLREELLAIATPPYHKAIPYPYTIFTNTDSYPEQVHVPIPHKKGDQIDKRIVWSIDRTNVFEHEHHGWSRRRRLLTAGVGIPVVGLGAAALAVALTQSSGPHTPNSPEYHNSQSLGSGTPGSAGSPEPSTSSSPEQSTPSSSPTQNELSCASGETPVYPGSKEPNTPKPKQTKIVFHPPGQPELDVVVKNNQLLISQSPWIYSSVTAIAGDAIKIDRGVIHKGEGEGNLLYCENPPKTASSSASSSNASIPGT